MKITRLSWAGLLIESATTTLYVDPLENVADMIPFLGQPKFPLFKIPAADTREKHALITHIHPDHFDLPLLKERLTETGNLWGPGPVYHSALADGLNSNEVQLNQTFTAGDFQITPVPAVDWVGDEQVSYVISDGVTTVFHGGDTNWHGYWWNIASQFGPFKAAFLPVNGVIGAVPGLEPASEMFGTLTPVQAVSATRILRAGQLIPMHYAQFDNPPLYREYPDIDNTLNQAGYEQGVTIMRLADGETVEL